MNTVLVCELVRVLSHGASKYALILAMFLHKVMYNSDSFNYDPFPLPLFTFKK